MTKIAKGVTLQEYCDTALLNDRAKRLSMRLGQVSASELRSWYFWNRFRPGFYKKQRAAFCN